MTERIQILFGPLHFGRRSVSTPYDRLLGINAPIRIIVQGREWFNEPDFPVVELAAAINAWLRRGGDFEFQTMEAEESPFLAVHCADHGCRITAAWQAFPIQDPIPFSDIREAFQRFADAVANSSHQQLHIDVDDLLRPQYE